MLFNKPTILVVDDTPANIALLSEVLKADYRVKVATSGERALTLIAAEKPDLILLDIMMPDLSGYQVCERLKADAATRSIPIIFVTAMGDTEDEERGLALGAVDYIAKPISPPIVRARVRTQLMLREQSHQLEQMVVQLEAQAAELLAWNATLEQRVTSGVQENERLARLKRFFSPSVADIILAGNADDLLKTRRREIVVVFLDIRGYTAFTETADPEDVMQVLREFHTAMGELIMEYGATLERFGGDSMMVFFNDPLPTPEPALTAVRMTMKMQAQLVGLTQFWQRRGFDLAVAIGIAQGYATIGTIGFEGRRDYGAIGTVTNLAARLCGEGQGGQILVSQRVQAGIEGHVATRAIGELTLKGFHRTVPAFEVLAEH
jgi:class 3 adenylate cyclase/AmiR/NasT family two-component response regulator